MARRREMAGFSALEVIVALALSTVVLLTVLATYSEATAIKNRVQGRVEIQSNLRLGMDHLERDLRMIGFAVPHGRRVGTTDVWTPIIFHAASTEIGFRSDIDGGSSEVVCSPRSVNPSCPLSKLRLDRIDYFQNLNCDPPDGSAGDLRLIATFEGNFWEPLTCSGYSTSDTSIDVSPVTDGLYNAGKTRVATVEHVYYRFVPGSEPPYGRLLRHVSYGNAPDSSFPPAGALWTTVADHLTDFWMQYRDGDGAALTGSPLSATQRHSVKRIVLFLEGYDREGPAGQPQIEQVRSEVLVRNALF